MSQTVVPAFYSTRKRFKERGKNTLNPENEKLLKVAAELEKTAAQDLKKSVNENEKLSKPPAELEKTVVRDLKKSANVKEKLSKPPAELEKTVVRDLKKSINENEKLSKPPTALEKTVARNVKKAVKKTSRAKSKGKNVNKITNYLKSDAGTSNVNVEKELVQEKVETPTPHVPKRNLTPEELTPSKKKPLNLTEAVNSQHISPSKSKSSLRLTPQKHDSLARKKLLLNSPTRHVSPKKIGSPSKCQLTPQKVAAYEKLSNKDLASLVEQSRTKILFSGKLDELKKSLEKFTNVSNKTKEFQANSCKITSVVSSAKSSEKESVPVLKGEPAYKKFSYLTAPHTETSFVLPYKYKLLGEAFRCLDTVVKMIYNRKEKVTFDKAKQGVQDMMKKNFLMNHLGQIMKVMPSAYTLEYEKCDSYNKSSSAYQLIITPILSERNDSSSDVSEKGDKKNKKISFISMTPQHLLERKHIFEKNLLKITKDHHREFLKRKNFPDVPDDKIVRWHPEFPVDSVPNIPIGNLPEEPDVKVCTARDVLNKLKGSVRGRVGKALQSVADEHEKEVSEKKTELNSKNEEKIKKQSSALKGICTDLLEKIRARESAKILETMTRSTQDEKRLEMLERLPKIVHILWHFFISERKAAVPVDVAVEKIIHSFNSLSTPDAVKEHLDLIRETMPGWLSVIKISKGEYLTIEKKRDINVMLANIK